MTDASLAYCFFKQPVLQLVLPDFRFKLGLSTGQSFPVAVWAQIVFLASLDSMFDVSPKLISHIGWFILERKSTQHLVHGKSSKNRLKY